MKAYLFPGQGSQRLGMGEGLFEAFPELTEAADGILGYSIRRLCLEDPERQLGQTRFTQPALYVVNALAARRRMAEADERPDFVAGHSLGEYNALECAGAIGFEDGLRLVAKRGELMSGAPKGTMAAVIGLEAGRVAELLASEGLSAIDVANLNARSQVIVSGRDADIAAAQAAFEKHGATYIPLNVSGAFHSRYMEPVREAFADFLRGFSFAAPQIPVIANVDARPYRAEAVAETLERQLTSSVRWLESMHHLMRQGVTEFLELGPGDVLTKLARTIRRDGLPAETATAAVAKPQAGRPASESVAEWNRRHPVGSRVRVAGYDRPLTTRTEAVVLFGHRAAVYMDGYNGYFALDEVEPLETVGAD